MITFPLTITLGSVGSVETNVSAYCRVGKLLIVIVWLITALAANNSLTSDSTEDNCVLTAVKSAAEATEARAFR